MKRVPGGVLVAVALTTAACSGSSAAPTTTTPTTSTTLAAATTTTTTTSTTVATTTTTAAPKPAMPFRGTPTADETARNRPAIVVKIDNSNAVGVRPQLGLERADIVFEEIVEGITRFAAVFHSDVPEQVGPVRSARTSDVDIVGQLSRPIMAWSGGNNGVTAAMSRANIHDAGRETGPRDITNAVYYRVNDRVEPHNLFVNTAEMYPIVTAPQPLPSPVFTYRPVGASATGGSAPPKGVSVKLESTQVEWSWTGTAWARSAYGVEHLDTNKRQITTENVVVLVTNYRSSPADPRSPEAVTVGQGDAFVLTGGRYIVGRWKRAAAAQPAVLTDESGKAIDLTPGRTWVELPRSSDNVNVIE